MEEFSIKIKRIKEGLTLPSQTEKGDWIDLRASEDTIIPPLSTAKVHLGIAMKLPDGFEAHLVPRSSLFKNFGVIQTNHIGIIDNTYCGDNDEWFVELFNMSDKEVQIPAETRIVQFRIMRKMPKVNFQEVSSLNSVDRGGHGSSGIY